MNEAAEVADRHLRAADGLSDALGRGNRFVRLEVSPAWAATRAGQLLTSCLVNLLCRQIGVVNRIEVVAPAAPVLVDPPFARTVNAFPDYLAEFSSWAVDGGTPISVVQTAEKSDQTIFIGHPGDSAELDDSALAVIGGGWRAWAGRPSACPRDLPSTSENPLGPFLAAALAAGEVFKRDRGILRGRYLSADGYSLWSGRTDSDWKSLEEGPELTGRALGVVHMIGAGAVGNAMAYIAMYLGLSEGYFIFIDDDIYDKKNLNRCLMAGWEDLTNPKVTGLAKKLKKHPIDAYAFNGTIAAYLSQARPGLRADVDRAVANLEFETVLSCVDKGRSRQDVQGLSPHLLIGGSTVDLQAKSNLYPRRPGAACLACFNPAERGAEKMHDLEKRLRGMSLEERRRYLQENQLPVDQVEDYLAGTPCGGVGEAAIRDFVTRPPTQFSVGFVSLAAGILLAATLLRQTFFRDASPHVRDMISLNFLNGGLLDRNLGHDHNCERQCQKRFEH